MRPHAVESLPPAARGLLSLRARIDRLDDELRSVLQARASTARELGTIKRRLGLPIRDAAREAEVEARLRAPTEEGTQDTSDPTLAPDELSAIMRRVIEACRRVQRPERVACLGPGGSFSEAAATWRFTERAALTLTPTITGALSCVARGLVDAAVVPADNTRIGPVEETRQALAARPELRVESAFLRTIELALLVRPGVSRIDEVHSRPEALAQCRAWLEAHHPGARRVSASSTSDAARTVAALPADSGAAAVASPEAAARYGLEVAAQDLTQTESATVFWVVRRRD